MTARKRPATKYDAVRDGGWVTPSRQSYKIRCCDCGLVHRLRFRFKGRHLQFQAIRDNRATAQARRKR